MFMAQFLNAFILPLKPYQKQKTKNKQTANSTNIPFALFFLT